MPLSDKQLRTPKPSTVRAGWAKGHPFPLTTEVEERYAEFDRMIAAVEAAVRADQIERDAAIAESLYFGPAPLFSQAAAHAWGAKQAGKAIRAQQNGDNNE